MGNRKIMNSKVEKKKSVFKSVNKKLVLLIAIGIFMYISMQIYTMSAVGTRSGEIESTRIEKNEIRLENEILESKIDELNSLANIDEVVEEYKLQEKSVNTIPMDSSAELALN